MDWSLYWTLLLQILIGFVPVLLMIFFLLSAIKYAVTERPPQPLKTRYESTSVYSTESNTESDK